MTVPFNCWKERSETFYLGVVLWIGPMPAGVSDGTIEDSAITASSFMDNSSRPFAGRLNSSAGAWCPNVNDKQQYLQIDLGNSYLQLRSIS